jgi:poly(A) polymerase
MDVLDLIRSATTGTALEGKLYLVGGVLRDRLLGREGNPDVDIVVEGDAAAAADLIHSRGLSDHAPVQYARFGTARVQVHGVPVEFATARVESYDGRTRKPDVRPATLAEDVMRRDFTINTLVENLHSPGVLDLTGRGLADLRAGVIRTPLDPAATFHDDPLRMLRAVRFAVTLGFDIEAATWRGVREQAFRLHLIGAEPRVVSAERVRDEFVKILLADRMTAGLGLLLESGLLARFLPELCAMVGVRQNDWHAYDVWRHTMATLDALPPSASLEVRLGALFHDVGKPETRTEDEGGVHFYDHPQIGARICAEALARLRMPGDTIAAVTSIVRLHMRLGEVRPDWSTAAVRRLIRDSGALMPDLAELARADSAALGDSATPTDIEAVMHRIESVNREMNVCAVVSPLDGAGIMALLGIGPGRQVGAAKEFLVAAILDGHLTPDDREGAAILLRRAAEGGRFVP